MLTGVVECGNGVVWSFGCQARVTGALGQSGRGCG